MPSTVRIPVTVRIRRDVLAIIEQRVKHYPGTMTVSSYINMRLEYDILRKHNPKKKRD
jgi:hypothetical protein